jgi:Tol biopolymer transport system component
MAHAFDASKLQFKGEPVPLAADVPGGAVSWGGAEFGTSESGVLAHLRGAEAASTFLQWRDRDGKVLEIVSDAATYYGPRLSHDGTRIATAVGRDVGDIWIYDLERDMRTRFTFDPLDERAPVWSPDDSHLAFVLWRSGATEIYVRPTSGQGDAKLLFTAGPQSELTDWSKDGRVLFFNEVNPSAGGSIIWTLDVQKAEATPLLSGSWFEDARLSPDGKWLAFLSSESGKSEIYVQSFPAAGGRWMVSSDDVPGNALLPTWRPDGRELFYLRGREIVAVPVSGDASFSFGTPKILFGVSFTSGSGDYSVSADGQRILTNELPPTDQSKLGAGLIQNWPRALKH